MRLFKRTASVTLARPTDFFRTEPNAVVVSDLRVAFSIVKSLSEEPNTLDLTITNLSERTRAEIQKLPLHVRLEAGYDGSPKRIFVGDARFAESVREGVDWNTKIQVGDGERAYRHARVNRSFRAGARGIDVVNEVARAMGAKVPTIARQAAELLSQYAAGVSLQGLASRELTRVLAPRGMSFSIQDGTLQILRGSDARAEEALVISQDAGMVGSPEYGSPPEEGKSPLLHVKTLLYPEIVPGSRVRVESVSIKGVFRVEKVAHEGDTHGEEWTTTVEAKPL